MVSDYIYWRITLRPEWYQSFTRSFVPPHPLPEGQTAITRQWKGDEREPRTYYLRQTKPIDRFPPEGQILLSRADEVVGDRASSYQSFVWNDIKIPDAVAPFPEGKQVFTRGEDRDVFVSAKYQSFWWWDHTFLEVPPPGDAAFVRADEIVAERSRSYQSFFWNDPNIPSPPTALPPGVQIFARVAKERELRAYYLRHAIFPDVVVAVPLPPGKSAFSRADETVASRFQSLVWSGAVISFVGNLPEGKTFFTRADGRVKERPREYQSFVWYNRIPVIFPLPPGRTVFSRADEIIGEYASYQVFPWHDHAIPDVIPPAPTGVYKPIFRPRRRS